MNEINERPVVGQTSVEVQELVDLLAACAVGEVLLYTTLTKAIGRDVQVHRHLLDSARRIAMRDHRLVFAAVAAVGVRRLSDVETVEICTEVRRKRIRTQARNGMRELSTVKYEALDRPKQIAHNLGLALFGGLYVGASRATAKKLARQVENGEQPKAGDLLRLIGWKS